jgi:HNH endonuclease
MSTPTFRPPNVVDEQQGTVSVPLTRGLWTVIDFSDAKLLGPKNWTANNGGYANQRRGKEMVMLHHLILPRKPGFDVDHIDGDKRNNRRSNLRYATRSENLANRRQTGKTKAKRIGVCWDSTRQKWMATIQFNKKPRRLGRFVDLEEAIAARERAEVELFGAFRHEGSVA